MSQPYIGEIRLVAYSFAPNGWEFCNGQLQSIADNDALFAIIGTTYGGDGVTTFALPNLQGRVPIHSGTGFTIGQIGGETDHTLKANELASHSHPVEAVLAAGNAASPIGTLSAVGPTGLGNVYGPPTALSPMKAGAIGNAGGSQPHSNMQPYLTLNYIISLFGVFPSRA